MRERDRIRKRRERERKNLKDKNNNLAMRPFLKSNYLSTELKSSFVSTSVFCKTISLVISDQNTVRFGALLEHNMKVESRPVQACNYDVTLQS